MLGLRLRPLLNPVATCVLAIFPTLTARAASACDRTRQGYHRVARARCDAMEHTVRHTGFAEAKPCVLIASAKPCDSTTPSASTRKAFRALRPCVRFRLRVMARKACLRRRFAMRHTGEACRLRRVTALPRSRVTSAGFAGDRKSPRVRSHAPITSYLSVITFRWSTQA